MQRAYTVFEVKSIDAEQRVIEGLASTPTTDRDGDVLDPAGAQFTLPMPLLWQHKHDQPIGEVISARVTDAGIWIKAQIVKDVLPEIDRSWALIKSRLVRGFSVGFMPIGTPERLRSGGLRFTQWNWFETSAVTIPANQRASIAVIKSFDHAAAAATGTSARGSVSQPGATGSQKAQTIMNVSEQITSAKAELQTKSARYEELLAQQSNEGGLTTQEEAELDANQAAINSLTKRVGQFTTLEAAQAAQAKSVTVAVPQSFNAGTFQAQTPTTPKIEVKNLEKGTRFTRYAMSVAAGKGSYSDTVAYAKRFTDTPEVLGLVKAVAGSTDGGSPSWGSELYNPNAIQTEFFELLRPRTIIGQIQGFDRVPAGVPVITQTGGSTFDWVGEGGLKPVGELAFERTTTGRHKVAGIVVITEELIRYGKPDAEAKVRNDMLKGCAQFLDAAFIQVAKTAGTNNPASITNGVSSPAASGTTLEALQADLNTALATFDDTGSEDLVIVTTPAIARGISMLTNPLGQTPNGFAVTPNGGSLLGYKVVVSKSVDAGTIVIFKPSLILMSGGTEVMLDASNQATLAMTGDTPTFGLWQNNCVGIRAEQYMTWLKARDAGVVAVIDTAAYAPTVGS